VVARDDEQASRSHKPTGMSEGKDFGRGCQKERQGRGCWKAIFFEGMFNMPGKEMQKYENYGHSSPFVLSPATAQAYAFPVMLEPHDEKIRGSTWPGCKYNDFIFFF
jgi:hypothetical protein